MLPKPESEAPEGRRAADNRLATQDAHMRRRSPISRRSGATGSMTPGPEGALDQVQVPQLTAVTTQKGLNTGTCVSILVIIFNFSMNDPHDHSPSLPSNGSGCFV